MVTLLRQAKGDIQSVHRAIDLLQAITQAGDAGVSELARSSGLPTSTVHNLLRTMARRGFLVNAEGRYRIGPGISVLASRFDPVQALSPLVKPAAQEVAALTGLAVTVSILVGQEAWILCNEAAPNTVTVSPPPSAAHPFTLATGRLLVSLTREAGWADFIATAGDIEPDWDSERWIRSLSEIRASGVSYKLPRVRTYDAVGLAVPVWTAGGAAACAIGCFAVEFMITDALLQTALDALWDTSVALSAALGCLELPRPKPTLTQIKTQARHFDQ